jgi:hypothetical protein
MLNQHIVGAFVNNFTAQISEITDEKLEKLFPLDNGLRTTRLSLAAKIDRLKKAITSLESF